MTSIINSEFKAKLEKILPKDNIYYDEPLSKHSYFKIGGAVDVLLLPTTFEQVAEIYTLFKSENVPILFIGNGSNILFGDCGVRGGIIKISKQLSKVEVECNKIIAEAGALMPKIASVALEHSLSGYEFASGIPGTVGGAVFMNAGAYGGEMADVVTAVTVLNTNGEIVHLQKSELSFRYRGSSVQDNGDIVLAVELTLEQGEPETIKALIDDYSARRRAKQPLNFPSAGSTFKRPTGYYAGKLIQDAGLRGKRYKDAAVSEKHCGFIVNLGNATASDVLHLIKIVQDTVYEKFAVELEPEVRMIGEDFYGN